MRVRSVPTLRVLVVLTLVGLALLAFARPAYAADEATSYAGRIVVLEDGALDVTTTMTFDAATGAPAGLEQRLAVTQELIGERDYRFDVTGVRITADGQPTGAVREEGDHVVLEINAPGAREVEVAYRVTGAAVRAADGQTTVRWDLLQGLSVPAREVAGEMIVPGQFTDFGCVAGAPATQAACALAEGAPHDSLNPRFADGPRGPGEIVGVRMSFPAHLVAPNERIHDRWTLGRAFSGTGWPLAATLATLLLGGALLVLLHRRAGRDARLSGSPLEVARFEAVGAGEVEFHPSRAVLPGEVGTVADERVDPIDVTATILDLAVHGYLRIEELPRTGPFAPADWTFVRRDADPSRLRAYERALLDALTPAGGAQVRVSAIGPAVAEAIPQIQSALYDEVVAQGFFERRPDSTRSVWSRATLIVLGAGVVLTGVLAAFTRFGLTGLAIVALGLVLALVAQEMPARTAKGTRVLAGLEMLRSQLLSQPTDQMPEGREYHELSEVLPYAIVLGGVDRWLAALVNADTDDQPDSTDLAWYHGPEDWHLRDLPDSLRNFITTANGSLFTR